MAVQCEKVFREECDLCGRAGEVRVVEHDRVRDRRTRRKYQYNVLHLCDECYREWAEKLEGVGA